MSGRLVYLVFHPKFSFLIFFFSPTSAAKLFEQRASGRAGGQAAARMKEKSALSDINPFFSSLPFSFLVLLLCFGFFCLQQQTRRDLSPHGSTGFLPFSCPLMQFRSAHSPSYHTHTHPYSHSSYPISLSMRSIVSPLDGCSIFPSYLLLTFSYVGPYPYHSCLVVCLLCLFTHVFYCLVFVMYCLVFVAECRPDLCLGRQGGGGWMVWGV